MSLLPILKILVQIQSNKEDLNFVLLMSQSQALADSHRLKIVKAHALIKAYKHQGIGNQGGADVCARKFAELLNICYRNDQVQNVFS